MFVTLPDPGEGLLEAEIVRWLVAPGQTVAVNDPLLEIETAKSLVELPSPYAGVVGELLVAEGDTVPVGSVLLSVLTDADPVAPGPAGVSTSGADAAGAAGSQTRVAAADGRPTPATPPDAPASAAVLVGYGAAATSAVRRPRIAARDAQPPGVPVVRTVPGDTLAVPGPLGGGRVSGVPGDATTRPPGGPEGLVAPGQPVAVAATGVPGRPDAAPGQPVAVAASGVPRRPLATPVVRRLARDLGIDLADVPGTGPDGQVTPTDVVGAVAGTRRPEATHIPLRGVRRQMLQSMAASVETPQASIWLDVDVTGTVELIDTLRARREFAHVRVSPLLVIAKAVCLALARHPELNSTLHLDRDEIVVHPDVNLGIATATQRGLVVPTIKRAQELNLLDLAGALNEMVGKARDGLLTPSDCAGGTFSITNVGVFGVEGGTPILNPGESAILCLGAINRRPWVVGTGDDERIVPRAVATLALTIDHRVLDGEQGARFLADVATIVSDPGLALLF